MLCGEMSTRRKPRRNRNQRPPSRALPHPLDNHRLRRHPALAATLEDVTQPVTRESRC